MSRTKQGAEVRYPVEVRWSEEDRAFIAEVYDLPGCMADGQSELAAIKAAYEAARTWLEVARAEKRPIPPPSTEARPSGKFNLRIPVSLHRRLQAMARREGVSLNQIVLALLAEREAGRRTRER